MLLFKVGLLLATTLILGSMSTAFADDDLTGQASIIDSDTLEIHGTRIRLWGVDAQESSQLCRGEDIAPRPKSANSCHSNLAAHVHCRFPPVAPDVFQAFGDRVFWNR